MPVWVCRIRGSSSEHSPELSLMVGAVLVAAADRPEALAFVTLDRNLARAAQLEGFRVLAG